MLVFPSLRRFRKPVNLFLACCFLAAAISPGGRVAAQDGEPPTPLPPEVQELEQLGAAFGYGPGGRIRLVQFGGRNGALSHEGFAPGAESGEAVARRFLEEYGTVFGFQKLSQELRTLRQSPARGIAGEFVRFQQLHQGVPVLGGEMIVLLDGGGGVKSATGELLATIPASTSAFIDAGTAAATALAATAKWHGVDSTTLTATPPELWIYDPSLIGPHDGPAALVWRVDIASAGLAPVRELVLVDAQQGSIALHFNQVDTVGYLESTGAQPTHGPEAPFTRPRTALGAPDMATYTANNSISLPGTFLCDESAVTCTTGGGTNPDANAAHRYARDTYDFYADNFSRDSINGAGMQLVSTVNYGNNFQNAFWNGSQMVYGDGYALADDVVGHELTHGVTDHESNLLYYYQSGAINEAFSDIFGEFVDLTNGSGNDSASVRWLLGEDLPIGAIRDMADPPSFCHTSPATCDPDRMTNGYYTGPADNGGVHINSGVANKAASLMVDGGTFNGITVTALGIPKVAAVWYEAQANLLTSGADYLDLHNALYQACQNLAGGATGITVFDCIEVRDATLAVEMHLQPVAGFNTDAPICASGQAPNDVFFDGFESGLGNWTTGSIQGVNRWQQSSAAARSGLKSLYADDGSPNGTSDSYAAMTSAVTVPANAYLHFAHWYGFEFSNNIYWDGGVLEYSTTGLNGTWIDANSLLDASANPNNGYDATLTAGNPLGARQAFADDSHGYISSRYNLASLAGQSVRFRFRMGTDFSVADAGWWVDDVRVYTCGADPNQPTFVDVPFDYWAHDYIEALWDNGFTAGCNTSPLMYCPETTMNRAESAVFVLRGVHGAGFLPTTPADPYFDDTPTDQWYTKWAEQLYVDGYTGGCSATPPLYCPLQGHTRAEASVFYLRMLHGPSFVPPEPATQIFADVPLGQWYTKWAHAAYDADLLEACETIPSLKFCPNGPLTRALAAYMMVKAKNLSLP